MKVKNETNDTLFIEFEERGNNKTNITLRPGAESLDFESVKNIRIRK